MLSASPARPIRLCLLRTTWGPCSRGPDLPGRGSQRTTPGIAGSKAIITRGIDFRTSCHQEHNATSCHVKLP